jgi:hypothetical protein
MAVATLISTPEELLDEMKFMLDDVKQDIGLKFVGYGDETQIISGYPAAVISSGNVDRTIATTHQFGLILNSVVWVYHALLTESHAIRTKNDLLLATEIRELFHDDLTLGGKVIAGYFDSEIPGQLNYPRGDAVIATRMSYLATSRKVF